MLYQLIRKKIENLNFRAKINCYFLNRAIQRLELFVKCFLELKNNRFRHKFYENPLIGSRDMNIFISYLKKLSNRNASFIGRTNSLIFTNFTKKNRQITSLYSQLFNENDESHNFSCFCSAPSHLSLVFHKDSNSLYVFYTET